MGTLCLLLLPNTVVKRGERPSRCRFQFGRVPAAGGVVVGENHYVIAFPAVLCSLGRCEGYTTGADISANF
jgi:hypothetical protein